MAANPFRSWGADRRGGTALAFALMLLPLSLGVGVAIDYNRVAKADDALQNAADAAALMALSSELPSEKISDYAQKQFLANLTAEQLSQLEGVPTLVVERHAEEGVASATFTYTGNVATTFMRLANIETVPIGGTSVTKIGLRRFVDIHVLLDTSDSMGLGAGLADRDKLREATAALKMKLRAEAQAAGKSDVDLVYPDSEEYDAKNPEKWAKYFVARDATNRGYVGCEFACHIISRGTTKYSTLDVARTAGVELRIDTATRGIGLVADLAEAAKKDDSYVRLGLNVFSTNYRPILPITADLTAFKNALDDKNRVGLGTAAEVSAADIKAITEHYGVWNTCWNRVGNSFFDYAVPQMAADVKKHAAKAASKQTDYETPQQVVLIVSDGLKSQNCASSTIASQGHPGKENVFPFRPSDCAILKDAGALVAVIYTEYQAEPLPTYLSHARHAVEKEQNYNYIDKKKSSGIEDNMKACASPGLFAKGSEPDQIIAAFDSVFDNIKKALYISG